MANRAPESFFNSFKQLHLYDDSKSPMESGSSTLGGPEYTQPLDSFPAARGIFGILKITFIYESLFLTSKKYFIHVWIIMFHI